MPTRTDSTKQAYDRRVIQLRAQCALALELDVTALTNSRFVAWLLSQRERYAPNTWRQYRAAVNFCLAPHQNLDSRNALQSLQSTGLTGGVRRSRRTSALKAKRLPAKDVEKLFAWFRSRKPKYAALTCEWLTLGQLTGARPCEWYDARLQINPNGTHYLRFRNAKATNGRGNGSTRTLQLEHWSEPTLAILQNFIHTVQAAPNREAFTALYNACRKTLYCATRDALGKRRIKHVTLYSGRHQFIANAKSSGLLLAEIAALVGHASDATASEHYGLKRHGHGRIRVKPEPDEIATVRSRYNHPPHSNEAKPRPRPS